jgi:predicted membrane protein
MENSDKDKTGNADQDNPIRRRSVGRVVIPLGLVAIGGLLLVRQMGVGLPEWLFSWPMLLIGIGIISGLVHAFRGPGWLILIVIGSFFLMDRLIPGLDIHRFIWPAVIIMAGLIMLVRPRRPYWGGDDWYPCHGGYRRRRWRRRFERRFGPDTDYGVGGKSEPQAGPAAVPGFESKGFSSEDYISATTVLGGVHKNILSKNFKGGDITIFMGGAELNLSQADIQGKATLDITQIMGGTKIVVPPHWTIRSELTSVFGSIEDKRQNIGTPNPDKVLIIDGTSVFGGIEIRNY